MSRAQNLLDNMKTGLPFETRTLIRQKLRSLPDSEIETTSLKVSLICPLAKRRMKMPCRSSDCSHVQCFDALFYLQMNEHNKYSTYKCPICGQLGSPFRLTIDGLFSDILKKASASCDEVVFDSKGKWTEVMAEESVKQSKSKQSKNKSSMSVNIDFEKLHIHSYSSQKQIPIITIEDDSD